MVAVATSDKPMTKSRNILPPRRPWTEVELELLRRNYADSLTSDLAIVQSRPAGSVHQKAAVLGLAKSAAFIADTARERSARPDHGGRKTRFQAGQASWSKGTKGVVGVQEGCRATQFKKGRPAHEARNYLPIGSLRLSKDCYLERKVTDDPALAPARRWVGVHRLVWEAEHGPVPSGHAVAFLPGRRTAELEHITVDALELVSRAELMRRNTYHQYGPEVAKVVQLRGAITRQINKRDKA